jgi:hypothetical protein
MFVLYRGLQCILKTSLNEETKIKIKTKKIYENIYEK